MTDNHDVHPLADMYPMLDEQEFLVLAESIKTHGQQQPIIVDAHGRVIDGRNRLAACRRAKVEPVIEVRGDIATDAQVADFIRDANNARRHLSTGQRVAAEALLLHAAGMRHRGRWKKGAIPEKVRRSMTGFSSRMTEAGVVLDVLGERALRTVLAGGMTLDAALKEAKRVANAADPDAPEGATDPVVTDPVVTDPLITGPEVITDPEVSDPDPDPDTLDRAEQRAKRQIATLAGTLRTIRSHPEWTRPYGGFDAYCEKRLGLRRGIGADAWTITIGTD